MRRILFLLALKLLLLCNAYAQTGSFTGTWLKIYDDGITRVSVDYRVAGTGDGCYKISTRYLIDGAAQSKTITCPVDYNDCSGNIKTFKDVSVPLSSMGKYINSDHQFSGEKIIAFHCIDKNGNTERKITTSGTIVAYTPEPKPVADSDIKYSAHWIKVYDDSITSVSVNYRQSSDLSFYSCSKILLFYRIEGRPQKKSVSFPINYKDCNNHVKTFTALNIPLSSAGFYNSPDLEFDGEKILSYDFIDKYDNTLKNIPVVSFVPENMEWGRPQVIYKSDSLMGYVQFALSPSSCDPTESPSFYRFILSGNLKEKSETIETAFSFFNCASHSIEVISYPLQIGPYATTDVHGSNMSFRSAAVEKVARTEVIITAERYKP